MIFVIIYHFYLEKVEKLVANFVLLIFCIFQLIICYSHKKFKVKLVIEMVLRVIKFYKKTWLNSYTDMDTDLGKASNMILKKTFSTQ